MLHVPLIVRFPDARAERIDEPASTLDIVPTVLDVVGLAVPPHLSGRSLRGAVEPRVVVAEVVPGFRALRLGDLKLIESDLGGRKLLFDLRSDPGELRDLSESRSDDVQRLSGLLREHLARHGDLRQEKTRERGLNRATMRRLRALGYLDRR